MDKKRLDVSEELLQNLPLDDFVELKIEVDDLINKIDDILEICETSLNS